VPLQCFDAPLSSALASPLHISYLHSKKSTTYQVSSSRLAAVSASFLDVLHAVDCHKRHRAKEREREQHGGAQRKDLASGSRGGSGGRTAGTSLDTAAVLERRRRTRIAGVTDLALENRGMEGTVRCGYVEEQSLLQLATHRQAGEEKWSIVQRKESLFFFFSFQKKLLKAPE
jgi:hypothetical protein